MLLKIAKLFGYLRVWTPLGCFTVFRVPLLSIPESWESDFGRFSSNLEEINVTQVFGSVRRWRFKFSLIRRSNLWLFVPRLLTRSRIFDSRPFYLGLCLIISK